ncbi:MAG: hypothetical protein ACE14T_05045 [Syntrophales bacterium]
MYYTAARGWIDDMLSEGKLKDLSREELDALAREYSAKLENFFQEEVTLLLEKMGKGKEYERMLLYDGQYANKYLNQTIPGFPAFRMEVFEKARKIITGQ